jgi:hypothetical protein
MLHRALACPDLWDRVYLPRLVGVHGLLLFRRTCRQARDLPIAPHTLAKVFLPDVPDAWLQRVCEANPRPTPSCIAHAVKTILFPEVPRWPPLNAPALYSGIAKRYFGTDVSRVSLAFVCTGLTEPFCKYHMLRTVLIHLARSAAGRQKLLSAMDIIDGPAAADEDLTRPAWRCQFKMIAFGRHAEEGPLACFYTPSLEDVFQACTVDGVTYRQEYIITGGLE